MAVFCENDTKRISQPYCQNVRIFTLEVSWVCSGCSTSKDSHNWNPNKTHVKTHIVAVTFNRAPLSWLPDLFSVKYALRQKTQQIFEQGSLLSNIIGLFMYSNIRLLRKPERCMHDSPVTAKLRRFLVSYLSVYIIITRRKIIPMNLTVVWKRNLVDCNAK